MSVEWVENATPDYPAPGGVEARGRSAASRSRPWIWRSLGLLAAASATGLFAQFALRTPVAPPVEADVALSPFVARQDLPSLFSLGPFEKARGSAKYETRIREADGERRDVLTLGDPTSDEGFFRVAARTGGLSGHQTMFFVDLAAQSAEIGEAVARAANPEIDRTARGAVAISEMTLANSVGERACLGFRFNPDGAAAISGLACASRGKAVDRASFDCLIDRLSVTPAGLAAGLGEVIAAEPARLPACSRASI